MTSLGDLAERLYGRPHVHNVGLVRGGSEDTLLVAVNRDDGLKVFEVRAESADPPSLTWSPYSDDGYHAVDSDPTPRDIPVTGDPATDAGILYGLLLGDA